LNFPCLLRLENVALLELSCLEFAQLSYMKKCKAVFCSLAILISLLHVAQFKFARETFTVPDGFIVEQISDPSLVQQPVTGSFDEEGRLNVSDSSGSNEKVETQLEKKPHRILRLEDIDGDGKFDKSPVFADKMMFPEGTMWLDG
jgi:hypothetical protein